MRILLTAAILLSIPANALATPVVGQSALYRYDSTHTYAAIVTSADIGDGSQALVVLDLDGNSYSWPFGPGSQAAFAMLSVVGVWEDDTGTTDNRWRPNPDVPVQGPTGATGATGPAGQGSYVTSSSTPSLALNGSSAQLDATHDAELTVTVKIATSLSLTGGSAGHVDLVCDSSSTPTTVVETVSAESTGTLTIGLNLVTSSTLVLRWRVPAGHYCKLTTTNDTGTPTFTLIRQVKQTLG